VTFLESAESASLYSVLNQDGDNSHKNNNNNNYYYYYYYYYCYYKMDRQEMGCEGMDWTGLG
jgi:hypothetical protein